MSDRRDAHMRSSDAFSWYMERDPELRSTVVAVVELEQPPDWERLVARQDRASRILPHFRQRLVVPPLRLATPRWTTDPDFDLMWHVRRERIAAPGRREELLEFARRKAMTAFDPAHPLWEVTLLEGLEGGRAAFVMKLHHSLTDGIGGMQMAMVVFDLDAAEPDLGPMPPAPASDRFGGLVQVVGDAVATRLEQVASVVRQFAGSAVPAAMATVRSPSRALGELTATVASIGRTVEPLTMTLSPVMAERHLGRELATIDVPLAGMRAAARAAGATLNDAFLAAVTGGLRRYHETRGAPVDELRITLPISIRRATDPMGGNRITLQRFRVPVRERDTAARMGVIGERTRRAREERSLPLTDGISAGLNLLPPAYLGGILKHVDFLASNVPGPQVPIYLAGARVVGYYPFGPTIGAAVNLTLLSYCGTCYVGLNIDTAAVPDPDELVAHLRAGFDEVLALGAEAKEPA